MRKIGKIFRRKDAGSMGIGAMIIFIAMILVAGIAASVLVQVANNLQMQALFTGTETIEEVATGIAVDEVVGHVSNATDGMDLITIGIRGRAGSAGIDLNQAKIELANNDTKMILSYDNTQHASSPDNGSIFNTSAFDLAANEFGIIVIQDADNSLSMNTDLPIINRGDLVLLTINATSTFSPGLAERVDIWGNIIPEIGSWGIIAFRTPATYVDEVFNLQ